MASQPLKQVLLCLYSRGLIEEMTYNVDVKIPVMMDLIPAHYRHWFKGHLNCPVIQVNQITVEQNHIRKTIIIELFC